MFSCDSEVAIIGGAAGIVAARQLRNALVDCLILEARPRPGGRAWTNNDDPASPIDLGCGWLHSADRNPWTKIAAAQGRSIDRTPPPWTRRSSQIGFPISQQNGFSDALKEFYKRLDVLSEGERDIAPAACLEPLGRWNGLINAVKM